jgi:hypothetical protein
MYIALSQEEVQGPSDAVEVSRHRRFWVLSEIWESGVTRVEVPVTAGSRLSDDYSVRIPSRFLLHQGILFATILLVNYCTEYFYR